VVSVDALTLTVTDAAYPAAVGWDGCVSADAEERAGVSTSPCCRERRSAG